MNDKTELLRQLKIERPDDTESPSRLRWWVAAAVALVVVSIAIYFLLRSSAIPVTVAVAHQTGDATRGAGTSLLDASGYVVARRQATVSAKITGKVTEVLIEEGQHVDKDAVVGRLDDTNVRAALEQVRAQLAYSQASLSQVSVNLANAERDWRRKNELVQQHFVSQADLDNARTTLDALRAELVTAQRGVEVSRRGVDSAQRNLDDTVVRAPFAGVVTVKAAQPGEIVSPISAGGGFTRTGIGTIVDMDSLEVEVDVNESFIARVHAEQPASVRLNAYPDWQIPAYVIAIIPTADRAKATVKVRIGFKVRDPRILPDMGARVAFLSDVSPSKASRGDAASSIAAVAAVELPAEAVQAQGENGVVYVIHDGKVERRAVRLGAADAGGQQVLSGLAVGERVAVGDFARLSDGAKIKEQ
ncbi:MAG: efflux RND transporter periplasmic adaptor subunit [Proteobacteria bacterium]|nr:efflux RND transporter periplasmic adaptor subunit [Pseudomonadota bacterium]